MPGSRPGESPYLSGEEIDRARRRLDNPYWKPAADGLLGAARELVARERPLPAFDSSWYDADPHRDYGDTYVQWHDYVRPAMNLMRDAATVIRAGLVFREDAFLERAAEWALHVADHLGFHVQHHDAGLCYSPVGESMAEAWCLLQDRLTEDERERLRQAMERCGAAILQCTRHWLADLSHMPYNNHFGAHRRGTLCLGLALGRQDWVDQALNGTRGFGELLVGATLDDGLCYESSTTYHFASLGSLVQMAEMVRHRPDLGRDLYRESFANGRCLKQMLDAPLRLLLPDGEMPPWGDCYAGRAPLWSRSAGTYEKAYAVYGDAAYAWLLEKAGVRDTQEALFYGVDRLGPAEAPQVRSRLWIEHGYALLTGCDAADYWLSQAPTAVLTGDRSGIHHHYDALSLQVAAGGLLWTEDVESRAVQAHAFSAPVQAAFNRTMLAHNLVVVDEQDQRRLLRPLSVVEFKDLPGCCTVAMADHEGAIAPGVRMMRTVAVTPAYCLDVFQVASDSDHRYDWLAHPRAAGPVACPAQWTDAALPDRTPYSILRNAVSAPADAGRVELEWAQDGRGFLLALWVLDASGQPLPAELTRAEWPVIGDWSGGGRELFMCRVRGARADFVALYQLRGEGRTWRIAAARRVFNGEADEVHVALTDGQETRLHLLRARTDTRAAGSIDMLRARQ
jgi:hypothetical protein